MSLLRFFMLPVWAIILLNVSSSTTQPLDTHAVNWRPSRFNNTSLSTSANAAYFNIFYGSITRAECYSSKSKPINASSGAHHQQQVMTNQEQADITLRDIWTNRTYYVHDKPKEIPSQKEGEEHERNTTWNAVTPGRLEATDECCLRGLKCTMADVYNAAIKNVSFKIVKTVFAGMVFLLFVDIVGPVWYLSENSFSKTFHHTLTFAMAYCLLFK